MISKLTKMCSENFLEYTIDGGSKHPNVAVHIWSTYDTKFHLYINGSTFQSAIEAAVKQLDYCVLPLGN